MITVEPSIRTAIRAMSKLYTDESKWSRYVMARDANNRNCNPRSPRANCWCLMGAAIRIAKDAKQWKQIDHVMRTAAGGFASQCWNDDEGRTFEEVRALLRKAARIKQVEADDPESLEIYTRPHFEKALNSLFEESNHV